MMRSGKSSGDQASEMLKAVGFEIKGIDYSEVYRLNPAGYTPDDVVSRQMLMRIDIPSDDNKGQYMCTMVCDVYAVTASAGADLDTVAGQVPQMPAGLQAEIIKLPLVEQPQ